MEQIVEVKKKAVIMCMQMKTIEISPARYQLIRAMNERGIEIFLFLCGRLSRDARNIRNNIQHFLNTSGMDNKAIQNKIIKYRPDIVVAFTYEDTEVLFSMPIQLRNTDFFYFNLEITTLGYYMQSRKKNTWGYITKKINYPFSLIKEAIYTRNCKLLVIQDKERQKVARSYFLAHKKTILIPNSYIYDKDTILKINRAGIVYSGGARKKYLIDHLSLFDKVTTVSITFAGSFDEWSKEQITILHRTNPNIAMENKTLEMEEYTDYLQKYAVGLICYSKSDDDNIHHIGLSSGKFFKHLSIGQPVIIMGASMLRDEVCRYGLGIAVEDASEIDSAYKKIMENYNQYQQNIMRTYQNKYDFRKLVKPFLDCL